MKTGFKVNSEAFQNGTWHSVHLDAVMWIEPDGSICFEIVDDEKAKRRRLRQLKKRGIQHKGGRTIRLMNTFHGRRGQR
jgi:hypothetical protein